MLHFNLIPENNLFADPLFGYQKSSQHLFNLLLMLIIFFISIWTPISKINLTIKASQRHFLTIRETNK